MMLSGYEIIAVIMAMVGCTWKLCAKLNSLVPHEVCKERRKNCECVRDMAELKERLKQLEHPHEH